MSDRSQPPRMDGWKAIARYLGRDRTTAMRWAAHRGLPVHRVPGGRRATVYAVGHELDSWLLSPAGRDGPSGAGSSPARLQLGRREVIAGALVATVAGASALGLVRSRVTSGASEADTLLEQARVLRNQNTLETQNQAIGLAREAVRLAPGDASAWGALGYARALASRWRREAESRRLREQATIAAQRSLELDPGNAKGELALATALPLLGQDNWLARDNGLQRALARSPRDPDVLIERAFTLRFTGQCEEAVAMCARVAPSDYAPTLFNIWVRSLWSLGRIAETNRKLAQAVALYPTNKMLWFTQLELRMFDGRADEAAGALAARNRPSLVTEGQAQDYASLAQMLVGRTRHPTDALVRGWLESARKNVRLATNAIRFAAVTGRLDEAFSLADAYFFGRGFAIGDDNGNGLFIPLSQRHTNFLFEPPIRAMRSDPRFYRLSAELGLDRYWRETRRPPDFRRMG